MAATNKALGTGEMRPTVYVVWHRKDGRAKWTKVLATEDTDRAYETMEGLDGEAVLLTIRDPRLVGPREDNSGRPRAER